MTMKLMKAGLILTLAMLIVSACGMIPTYGSHTIISENRSVSGFDRLELSGAGGVTIIQDGTEALSVETDDNVMQDVTSKVLGGTLSIGLDVPSMRSVIPSRLSLILHVKDLSGLSTSGSWKVMAASFKAANLDIATSGSGKVTIQNLTADKLTVDISGSGQMDLAGLVNSQEVIISGSGIYQAGDLQAQHTQIKVSGSGNVTIWTNGDLQADLSGMGTIRYYGSPKVTYNESGVGSIKSLGNK